MVLMAESSTHIASLAVACNSTAIRLYRSNTWNCVLATGDTDTVLCLETCPGDSSSMASGGKDREARVWMISIRTEVNHEKDIQLCLMVV